MGRLPDDSHNEALRKLAGLCFLRAEGIFSEDQIAQKLDFVDEEGIPLIDGMYEHLEALKLPNWVVYPDGRHERVGKENTRLNPKKERKARSFGQEKEELPPAEAAEFLFRRDLARLTRYIGQLRGMRERRQEEPERWLSYSWVDDDWESYDRSDFSEDQWRRLCEEHGVDPAEESFAFDLAPSGSPLGVGPAPWEGLIYLIALHALMNESIEPLLGRLHPKPDDVDLVDLHKKKGKDGAKLNGVVTNLRAYAAQLAKVMRGSKGGGGAPAPGLSRGEMWVAWDLIHPLAQEGLSYEGIQGKLDEDGSLEVANKVLGYELTVAEIDRLKNLTRSPY